MSGPLTGSDAPSPSPIGTSTTSVPFSPAKSARTLGHTEIPGSIPPVDELMSRAAPARKVFRWSPLALE